MPDLGSGAARLPAPMRRAVLSIVTLTPHRHRRRAVARPGETLAIMGPSGCGKTALMALTMCFHDTRAGVIQLDGHDLQTLEQSSIRRNIGLVLQDADPLHFSDSVRVQRQRPRQHRVRPPRRHVYRQHRRLIPEDYLRAAGLHGLIHGAQALLELRQLLRDGGVLVRGQGELR